MRRDGPPSAAPFKPTTMALVVHGGAAPANAGVTTVIPAPPKPRLKIALGQPSFSSKFPCQCFGTRGPLTGLHGIQWCRAVARSKRPRLDRLGRV